MTEDVRGDSRVTLHFNDYPELHALLCHMAHIHFRSPSQQLMKILADRVEKEGLLLPGGDPPEDGIGTTLWGPMGPIKPIPWR